MDRMKTRQQIHQLLKTYSDRLQVLEIQAAKFGLHTPAHLQLEIDDVREQIAVCEAKLQDQASLAAEPSHTDHSRSWSSVGFLILAGLAIACGMLDAWSPAISVLSPRNAMVGTILIGGLWTGIFVIRLLRSHSRMELLMHVAVAGIIGAIWIPSLAGLLAEKSAAAPQTTTVSVATTRGLPTLTAMSPTIVGALATAAPTLTAAPYAMEPDPTVTALSYGIPTETSPPTSMLQPPTTLATAPPTPAIEVVIDNFLLQALPCTLINQILECTLFITNQEPMDRTIRMRNGGNAQLWDAQGVEYAHTYMEIGGKTGYDLYEGVRFLPNVSVRSTLKFSGLSPASSSVKLLHIYTFIDDLTFELRDIPITGLSAVNGTVPRESSVASTVVNQYSVDVTQCAFINQRLLCILFITNQTDIDRIIRMVNGGDASLWDEQNTEHRVTVMEVGGLANRDLYDGIRFLPHVPVQAEMQFEGVSPKNTIIKLLEIRTLFTDDLVFELRDIPITR